MIEIKGKHCKDIKNVAQTEIKTATLLSSPNVIEYYKNVIQEVEKTYREFLIKLKQL
jgi:hypothetical protein